MVTSSLLRSVSSVSLPPQLLCVVNGVVIPLMAVPKRQEVESPRLRMRATLHIPDSTQIPNQKSVSSVTGSGGSVDIVTSTT